MKISMFKISSLNYISHLEWFKDC